MLGSSNLGMQMQEGCMHVSSSDTRVLCVQDKGYPRDFLRQKDNGFLLMRGRARVKLFDDAGAPLNAEIPNRECCNRASCMCSTMQLHAMHQPSLLSCRESTI